MQFESARSRARDRERTESRADSYGSGGSHARRSTTSGRRRRRPTQWDVREAPYGIPMPPPGAALNAGRSTSRMSTSLTAHPDSSVRGYIPGPNDIVRAPIQGESGPLAGINIEALRALLLPRDVSADAARASVAQSAAAQPMGTAMAGAAVQQDPMSMQASRHARRLYVGNLPADTTDVQIADFFNRALVASKGVESPGDPVISVYINLEKRFAFIETRTVREAAAGLALDGVRFREMFLRLRRPNDYNAGGDLDARPPDGFNPNILGIVSTQVSDGPNKVFIGGIPYNLTEDQIKNLLQSYGPLAAFNLIKEPSTGMSKGFAFFEFVDPSVVDAACDGLHGMQVGDKTLTVRRASQTSGVATGAATHASSGAGISAIGNSNGLNGLVDANALLTASTRVLELRNVVVNEVLEDDEEYEDIKEEMEEEGRKFGNLQKVVIPRPGDEGSTGGVGRVFLKYSSCEEAERAQVAMSGRRFDDRTVEVAFFDENKFEQNELDYHK